MLVGRVKEVWRYPLKSMAGERLEACGVGARGLYGDRGWALRDDAAGEIRGAKISPALMPCSARYREEPTETKVPHVDITLPGGARTASDDPEVNARLSELVGRKVTLWPLRPASDRAHYRRAMPAARLVGLLGRSRAFKRLVLGAMRVARLDGGLRKDFAHQDVILVLMANAGIVAAAGDAAPVASTRMVGYLLQAFAASTAAPLPKPPSKAAIYRALTSGTAADQTSTPTKRGRS